MMLMFPFCNAARSAGSNFSEEWGLPGPWQTALRFQAGVPGPSYLAWLHQEPAGYGRSPAGQWEPSQVEARLSPLPVYRELKAHRGNDLKLLIALFLPPTSCH